MIAEVDSEGDQLFRIGDIAHGFDGADSDLDLVEEFRRDRGLHWRGGHLAILPASPKPLRTNSRQATEDRSSGNDLFDQNSILNVWFERSGYLCLKFFLSSGDDLRRRIGPGECAPD